MTKNKKLHIILNEQNETTMYDNAQLRCRGYTSKKYQFLN